MNSAMLLKEGEANRKCQVLILTKCVQVHDISHFTASWCLIKHGP